MIKVEVRLYATLRKHRPELRAGEPLPLSVEEGTTAGRLLGEALGIPAEEAKTIFINGVARGPDHILADADRVGIFPPVAGG